jgi:hypothetical protein
MRTGCCVCCSVFALAEVSRTAGRSRGTHIKYLIKCESSNIFQYKNASHPTRGCKRLMKKMLEKFIHVSEKKMNISCNTLTGKSAEGGFRPPTPCPPMALGPDQTKLWHPLGEPDAFPPHAGGLLGSKIILDIRSGPSANPNSVAEILVARPPKKPFWHPTGAVPIPHTTTRALPTGPPTAAVHTRTVRGRPRAAGAERFLGMLSSVHQAFLPSQTPNFG